MHPKNLCRRSICWGFVFFTLLFSPSFSKTENLSDKIKRFVQGKADTLFVLPHEGVTTIRHTGNHFLFIQANDYQKWLRRQDCKLTLWEVERGILWEKTFKYLTLYELTGDENVIPKVLTGHMEDEVDGVTEIYDAQGNRLAEVKGKGLLYGSPAGTYFFTPPSMIDWHHLYVHDSLGNLLWTKVPPTIGFWQVDALSDSIFTYADTDSLLLLRAKDGKTLKGWSNESYEGNVDLVADAEFIVSKNKKYFALSGMNALFSFSEKEGFLWNMKFDWRKDYPADAALSPDGRILGRTFQLNGRPTYRMIKFFDNFQKGRVISEFQYYAGQGSSRSPKSSIEIFDSLATVVLPTSLALYYWRGITDSTGTKIFVFEPKNRTVVDSFTVKGFFTPVNSGASDSRFFQVTCDSERKKIFVLRSR